MITRDATPTQPQARRAEAPRAPFDALDAATRVVHDPLPPVSTDDALKATQLAEFLNGVLPPTGHYVLAVKTPKGMRHHWHNSPAALAEAATTMEGDVYFAAASYKEQGGPFHGRTQENVLRLQAFRIDIDVGPGKPFSSHKEVAAALKRAFMAGLPKPTFTVYTGGHGGVHLYWCVK